MEVPAGGSFGMPDHLKETIQKSRADKKAKPGMEAGAKDAEPVPPKVEDTGFEFDEKESPAGKTEFNDLEKINPLQVLKDIGVTFSEDDFHNLVFKGSIYKEVLVVKSPTRPLTVLFKTLTGEEFNEADELLAHDITENTMTLQGRDTRQNMWQLAFAVQKLVGKEIVKPVTTDGELDRVATARERLKVLNKLSPAVLRKLMTLFGKLTLAINALVEDPDNPLFEELSPVREGSLDVN